MLLKERIVKKLVSLTFIIGQDYVMHCFAFKKEIFHLPKASKLGSGILLILFLLYVTKKASKLTDNFKTHCHLVFNAKGIVQHHKKKFDEVFSLIPCTWFLLSKHLRTLVN